MWQVRTAMVSCLKGNLGLVFRPYQLKNEHSVSGLVQRRRDIFRFWTVHFLNSENVNISPFFIRDACEQARVTV